MLAAVRYDLRSKIASSGIEPLENLEGETSKSITSLDEESDTFEVGLTQCIPRAVAVALSDEEKPLESASKSVLELIKALQGKDAFVSSRRETVAKSFKRKGGRSPEAIWTIDSNDLLNHRGRIYVPMKNLFVRSCCGVIMTTSSRVILVRRKQLSCLPANTIGKDLTRL